MMQFLLLGTAIPENQIVNLLGIDLTTYSVINVKAPYNMVCEMRILYEYTIECEVCGMGVPIFSLKRIVSEKIRETDDIKSILNLTASYSRSLLLNTNSFICVKMDKCKKISIYPQYVELIVSVVGITDKDFYVDVRDWRWNSYWKEQAQYAECEKIVEYMNRMDTFVIIDYCSSSQGKALQCVSLLVI